MDICANVRARAMTKSPSEASGGVKCTGSEERDRGETIVTEGDGEGKKREKGKRNGEAEGRRRDKDAKIVMLLSLSLFTKLIVKWLILLIRN